MSLSASEEKLRAHCTWRHYDHLLHQVCWGPQEWLKEKVAGPEVFRMHLKEAVLVYSDQVPFWVKVTAQRQLYSSGEVRKRHKGRLSVEEVAKAVSGQTLMSQKFEAGRVEEEAGEGDMTQTRDSRSGRQRAGSLPHHL